MAGLNPTKKIIASGSWVRVQYSDDGTTWNSLGLVTKASYNEDFHVMPAKVLGQLGPISYDSQDYSCDISIGAFIPEVPNDPNRTGSAAAGNAIADMLPTRSSVQQLGKGKTFYAMRFINTGTEASTGEDEILALFSGVIVASDGADIQPGNYIQNNIKLYAVERLDPTATSTTS